MKSTNPDFKPRLTGRSLVASLCIFVLGGFTSASATSETRVTLYDNGHKTAIASPTAEALIQRCETRLNTADARLRLAVTPSLINRLRQQGLSIEIEYAAPMTFHSNAGQAITTKRLLIPLSGELSGPVTTVFFGNGAYQSGPLRSPLGNAELIELLRQR